MRKKRLEIDVEKDIDIIKALSSEARITILKLLADGPKNINKISEMLKVPQPTITVNIKILEECGLIDTKLEKGTKGLQKICSSVYDEILIKLKRRIDVEDNNIKVEQIEMPIGLFKDVKIKPTCGLTSEEKIIGEMDNIRAFYLPEHIKAQHLWFAEGYIIYEFPNNVPSNEEIMKLELSLELCSEAPLFNENYPSDIYIWINDVEIGKWTSPGDFGKQRGELNPDWWPDTHTQHGLLKIFTVDRSGSYVDGNKISDVIISDIEIEKNPMITLKIGNKEGARNIGGVSLFGKKFGNYPQDIILKIFYKVT